MRLGYQTLTWANFNAPYEIAAVIRFIKGLGFGGIEFIEPLSRLGSARSLNEHLKDAGLMPASISCGLNMDPEDSKDIDETRQRVDFARQLGIKDVMMCGGWLSGGVKKEKGSYEILAKKLDRCCEYAARWNMNIAFHPHKDTLVETTADIDALLQITDKAKLCLDIAHLAACGSDPVAAIRDFRKITTYMHLKDWDSGRRDFVELGRGEVDIRGCLAALTDTGYQGWAVVELDRTETTPEKSAGISADFLREAGVLI